MRIKLNAESFTRMSDWVLNCLIVIFLTVVVCIAPAQEPTETKDLCISECYPGKVHALGNTVNDNILVVYEYEDNYNEWNKGICELRMRIIYSDGTLSEEKYVDGNVKEDKWDVAWSPSAKSFLIVYISAQNVVFGKRVLRNGKRGAAWVNVEHYNEENLVLVPSTNKKFILFLERGGQVAAQTFNNKGDSFRTEKRLTNFSSGYALPICGSQDEYGNSICYFSNILNEKTADIGFMAVDYQLNVVKCVDVLSKVNIYDGKFTANYDPITCMHAFAFSEKDKGYVYYVCNSNGIESTPVTEFPKEVGYPRKILYDPANQRFAVFYYYWTGHWVRNKWYHFCLCILNPNGSIANRHVYCGIQEGNNFRIISDSVAISKTGNVLVVWSSSWPINVDRIGYPEGVFGAYNN